MRESRALFLTPRMKLVYRLVRKAGRSQIEVAKQLKVSQPAVSQTLAVAENRIAKLIRKCGFEDPKELELLLN